MYLAKTTGSLNPRGSQPQSLLQVSTVRSFEGGLNVTDTDLNMSPKYARVLDNLERNIDGSLSLRPGTVFLAGLPDTTAIINHIYFNNFIWTVQASGQISRIDGAGVVLQLPINFAAWANNHAFVVGQVAMDVTDRTFWRCLVAHTSAATGTFAADRAAHPTFWTANPAGSWPTGVTFVDFTIFNNDLIITNGRDKPLIVSGHPLDPNFLVPQFLVDKASLTNVNTPIAKYVITHGRFTVFAGKSDDPSSIFISAEDTSGTYFNDPAPNNAVNVDLGPRVSLGSSTITGMVAYRDKLLVTFERGVLPISLGVFTGTAPQVHTPTDDGFIEEFGCLSHRSLVSVGDDTFFCDNIGVNSITRINFNNTLRPVRASHLIDPLVTAAIQPLSQQQIEQYVFATYDLRNFRYMLFVPVFSGTTITETVCFSYTNIPTLKVQAWARLRGWIWQSAARTALQNVVFSRGNKLYAYDFDSPTQNADRRNDPAIGGGAGEDVVFDWEMPWADFKHRMDIKIIKYIALDTQGDATFTARAYVDNIKERPPGTDQAMLSMQFVGGDSRGYGDSSYGDAPYGGGRLSSDERLFGYNAKFKLLKLRMSGATKRKLRFISISIAYLHGSIRR